MADKAYDPTHLCLFTLALGTGHPIPRIPVYAEVGGESIIVQLPPGENDNRFDDLIQLAIRGVDLACSDSETCRRRVMELTRQALSCLLTMDAREELNTNPDETKKAVAKILGEAKARAGGIPLDSLSDQDLLRYLRDSILRFAQANGLAPVANLPPDIRTTWGHPLGVLASDHVGYLSFDLARLPSEARQAVGDAIAARRKDPKAAVAVSVSVYPMIRDDLRFDALEQNRFAEDAIFSKVELPPLHLPAWLKHLGLLTMQNPSLTDWRFSSGSFAINPALLIGEDGCETLLPSNLALHEFFLYQIIRVTDPAARPFSDSTPDGVTLGIAQEYRLAWYPLGHSLGQILYSLPLAPGESVNLAVIDWVRSDQAERTEQTKLNEQLIHNQRRDRTITETVDAAVKEFQQGSSSTRGAAGSLGISAGTPVVGGALGIAGSIGSTSASSSGSRDLAATTIQKLSDNISQASAAMRELQSTVVVHSVQSEKEGVETRTIVNYNHSHALTILYYEVLRHFRLVSEFVRRRPVVLVRMPTFVFTVPDGRIIFENRGILEAALLDSKLAEGFRAMERLNHRNALAAATPPPPPVPAPPDPANREFIFLTIKMKTGGLVHTPGSPQSVIEAELIGPTPAVRLYNPGGATQLNPLGSFTQADAVNTFTATLHQPSVRWGEISAILFNITPKGELPLSFSSIEVIAHDTAGQTVTLVQEPYEGGHLIIGAPQTGQGSYVALPTILPPAGPSPSPSAALPPEQIEDEVKRQELLAHLKFHNAYYSWALLLNQAASERAHVLDAIKLPDGSSLFDHVENRPLEVLGDYVAYPSTDPEWDRKILPSFARLADPLRHERLITLPTRGVFAEAKLGHCNASEEIDPTRFWDWQQSPIPHFAPEIAPVQAVTPAAQQQNLSPTALPSSVVNIVNPPSAPDPTAMAGALQLLGASSLFRDMSGQQQLTDLLKTLSDNSVRIAQAATAARGVPSGGGGGGSSSGGGTGETASGGGSSAPKGGSDTRGDAATMEKAEIDNEKSRLETAKANLTPKQQEVVREAATQRLANTPAITDLKTFVFKGIDYRGMDTEFAMGVRVFDNKDIVAGASNKVFESTFARAGSAQIKFKEPDPSINVQIDVDPVAIDFGVMTYTVPRIRLTGESEIKSTQSLVHVTVQQTVVKVSFEEESIDKAAKHLADTYGGALGFDEVIALKMLTDTSIKTDVEKGGRKLVKYSLDLPGNAFTISIK